jgi:hypothetical protein
MKLDVTHLFDFVIATVGKLRAMGIKPFRMPAMGSHGNATSAGQLEIPESYGITE